MFSLKIFNVILIKHSVCKVNIKKNIKKKSERSGEVVLNKSYFYTQLKTRISTENILQKIYCFIFKINEHTFIGLHIYKYTNIDILCCIVLMGWSLLP